MNFEEVLEYLFLDNIAQWHIYDKLRGNKYISAPNGNIYIEEKKLNERIIELQQKFITPYVIDNTEKSE